MILTIVVTHNGERWIRDCLESLDNSSANTDTIVVDNNSNDSTVALVKRNFPNVCIVEMDENVGFGRGCNVGMKRALAHNADYVFLLNQDAKIEPDAIQTLAVASEDNPGYGIISPLHCNWGGVRLDFRFSTYLDPVRCPSLCSDALLRKPLRSVYEAEFVNAAAWLIPIRVLEEVGGFDPMFFHYGEDENYIQRMRFFGMKVGVCPHARIFHDREQRHNTRERVEGAEYRTAMIKYADVNTSGPDLLLERRNLLRKRYLKQCLTGSRGAREVRSEIRVLQSVRKKVSESWHANKKPGPKYLSEQ